VTGVQTCALPILIPRETGTLRIGPVSVSADLVQREGFMRDVTEYFVARTKPIELNVRELPTEGRPRSFSGLIGEYRISAHTGTTRVSVGDPLEITLEIEGPLVESVRPPALHLQDDLASQFRVPEDLGLSQLENGRKIWRFTIRPSSDRVTQIPPIALPYFDTERGEYVTASTQPIPLDVSATRRVTLTDATGGVFPEGSSSLESSETGIAYNYVGPEVLTDQRFTIAKAMRSPIVIIAAAGPFTFWATSLVLVAVRKRSGGSRAGAERKRAASIAQRTLADAKTPEDVSRAIYAYLGRKLERSPSGLTPTECEDAVSVKNAGVASSLRELLEQCDASSYAGAGVSDATQLREQATSLVNEIEALWRARA